MCDGHRATIVGTPGKDYMRGTSGPDVIVGLGGYDEIDGRGGDDIICGNGPYGASTTAVTRPPTVRLSVAVPETIGSSATAATTS
jgi:hypothetical protein